jgi:hypothetical protein
MSADNVVRFDPRRSAAVWLTREGPAWLVLAYEHGWLHGDYVAAVENALWLSENRGLPVRGLADMRRVITQRSLTW